MTNQELTYWVTLALMPKIWTRRKNEIYVKCFNHVPRISIIDLFEESSCWEELGLTEEEVDVFRNAHSQLANNSFVVEDLLSQGYTILPIHSEEYPRLLKENLKSGAPTVIFAKGNMRLLKEPSIAIVGSRKADEVSLRFTDNIARKASSDQKVVVSGFAKGVDRQALDSSLECGGDSIIVLPQGIMTFSSGFKQYYKYMTQGHILVISSFAPKAPWSKEFAMARNPIIYGLASDIFVAQSDNKGGTWSGVIDGLRKNRRIYVRLPESGEKNANMELIDKGAVAVDFYGAVCDSKVSVEADEPKIEKPLVRDDIGARIFELLSNGGSFGLKEIRSALDLQLSDAKLRNIMNALSDIQKFKDGRRVLYCLKAALPKDLILEFD